MFGTEDFNKKIARFRKLVIGGIIFSFVLIVSFYATLAYFAISEVDENGGVKNTIIKYGKEIKEINNIINEDK